MKKLILIFTIVLMSLSIRAYEIGDWFIDQQTGVPSVVVFVDQSGEHGLVTSPIGCISNSERKRYIKFTQQLWEKKYAKELKIWKSRFEKIEVDTLNMDRYLSQARELYHALMGYTPTMPIISTPKERFDYRERLRIIEGLAPRMTGYGLHDQQLIVDYCKKNNINIASFSPTINWALELGEGWFIPGNYELELYAKAISCGINVRVKGNEMDKCYYMFKIKTFELHYLYPNNAIFSSTPVNSYWDAQEENAHKIGRETHGGYLPPNNMTYQLAKVLVDYFATMSYMLLQNSTQRSVVLAFKYF